MRERDLPPKKQKSETDPQQAAFNSLIKLLDPLRENPTMQPISHQEAIDFLESPLFREMFKQKFARYSDRKIWGRTNIALNPLEEATFQTMAIIISHATLSLSGIKSDLIGDKGEEEVELILHQAKTLSDYLRKLISPQDQSHLLGKKKRFRD